MRFALLFALVLTGCASSVSMVEEAEPLATSALDTIDGLREYLTASGADVLASREVPRPERPGVVRAASYQFEAGGRCTVLSYESAVAAEELAPETVRQENPEYSRGGYATYGASARQFIDVPTILFGRNVALCSNEPAEATRALRALGTFASQSPAPAPAGA